MTIVETAVDMSTSLGAAPIPSPVLTASGCSAFGRELEPFTDLTGIGAVVTKSVQLRPRSPALPSSVVTAMDDAMRLASS